MAQGHSQHHRSVVKAISGKFNGKWWADYGKRCTDNGKCCANEGDTGKLGQMLNILG
jgi:hypothetical protein